MDKKYSVKRYELKEIGNLLKKSHPSNHAKIKAQELSKVNLVNFHHRGYDVEILEPPIEENGLLKVSIKASKDGKELFVDNPLLYQSPPIMVHDGTYHKFINSHGDETDVMNFVEDPEAALKEIIVQTVEVLNKEII